MKLTKKVFAFFLFLSFWAVQNCAVVCAAVSSNRAAVNTCMTAQQESHACCQSQSSQKKTHSCNCKILSKTPAFFVSSAVLTPDFSVESFALVASCPAFLSVDVVESKAQRGPPGLLVSPFFISSLSSRAPPQVLLS